MRLWRVLGALGLTWLVAVGLAVGPSGWLGSPAQSVEAYGSGVRFPSPTIPRDFSQLTSQVSADAPPGLRLGVALVELGGRQPSSWAYQGDAAFEAASTYKLPVLMAEAEGISKHSISPDDILCYSGADYEAGYFTDYAPGSCFKRSELARRAGKDSDNTAGHIMVRYLGGSGVLNAYAQSRGAKNSNFFIANTTTPRDLAQLWVAEATGAAGGQRAQAWLYPLLENSAFEHGVPAGTPGRKVAHKVGMVDDVVSDAALVINGPHGAYVVVVCTGGMGGDAAWRIVAKVASQVSAFEAARQA